MGLYDPWRADMVAVNGEVAGAPALTYMHSRMKSSSEGRLILKERPRITTKTVDYDALSALPTGTLGKVNLCCKSPLFSICPIEIDILPSDLQLFVKDAFVIFNLGSRGF